MAKERKSFSAYIEKAEGELGIVGAYTSVMGNIDYGDDIITNGAFAKTISDRAGKIRVLDNHNSRSARDAIGKITDIMEVGREALPPALLQNYPDATGALYVEIQFMLDDEISAGIFRRIKAGVIDEYSIGFEIIAQEIKVVSTDEGDRRIRFIKEIKLYEISPVIFAMNDATMTVDAKRKAETGDAEGNPQRKKAADELPMHPTDGEENCLGCKAYGMVTEGLGFCKRHDMATASLMTCDDFETKSKRLVRDTMRESFANWMLGQLAEFMELGAYNDNDKERLEAMLDTLSESVMDMLPKDMTEREIPTPQTYTAPKSFPQTPETFSTEAGPPVDTDTPTFETKAEGLIAIIQARMQA